jgi:predicted permease
MQNLLTDIRYALRQFRLAPVFTFTAVLTLALGIGGTTAIFSLIHAVMLRSLPVADPGSLYRIGDGNECCVEGGPQDRWGLFTFPLYERLKASAPEFEEVAAFQAAPMQFSVRRANIERAGRSIRGEFVTGNYFSTFGVRSFAGRLFSAADDRSAAAPVAVLSYRAWQGTYGGDPSVLGSSYIVEGHPFTVIGIAPPGFFGETLRSDPPDLWLPAQQEPLVNGQGSLLRQSISAWLRVIGRLRTGATVAGISPRFTAILRTWLIDDAGYPAAWIPELKRVLPKQNINVVPAGSGVAEMKEDYGGSLQILLAVCCMVLLIACANIANLMLARGMARRSQTSLRLAMGASRGRIVSQSLTESVLLSLAGGGVGLVVADGAGRVILALAFHSAHFLPISTAPSVPVLAFAFALSLVTGVLFGTAPAWFATRTDPVEALRGANRSTADNAGFWRKALLVTQATLSVVLLAGAAMLTRSLNNLERQDFGFQTANRITVSLNSPPATYSSERLTALYRDLEQRLNHLPGVERASLALYNPFTDNWGELIFMAGHPAPKFNENSGASWDRVSPGYFQAVGQPILRGRGFTEMDNETSAPVAVVNEAFVRRFLPKEDPIDARFGIDLPAYARSLRIVGVLRDAKYTQPDKPARPMFFVPLAQHVAYKEDILRKIELRSHFIGNALLVTRTSPGTIEPLLKKAFAEADPNLTIINVRTMQEQVDLNFDQQRAVASLAGLFGLVALILAAVGLYGVTAYTVAQRTSEIGVRMALGANRPSVVQLVLRGAFNKVALGLLLGIPLAIGAGRLMSAQLYGVVNWDPFALAIAMGSLAVCAFIAAIIPAARAASIDPMKALRTE